MAPVASVAEVQAVVAALLRVNKIANATHNIMAYRIHVLEKQTFMQVADLDAGCGTEDHRTWFRLGYNTTWFTQPGSHNLVHTTWLRLGYNIIQIPNRRKYNQLIFPRSVVIQDSDDDGEAAAGGRLLHLLQVSRRHCGKGIAGG